MTTITRWEPFREMRRLHNMMDRIMDDSMSRNLYGSYEGDAPIDLFQDDEAIHVEAVMPGFKPEEVEISIRGDMLSIQGRITQQQENQTGEDVKYLIRERKVEALSRTLRLPTLVDADKASAELENGILKLTLPKVEAVKPKQITIKAK